MDSIPTLPFLTFLRPSFTQFHSASFPPQTPSNAVSASRLRIPHLNLVDISLDIFRTTQRHLLTGPPALLPSYHTKICSSGVPVPTGSVLGAYLHQGVEHPLNSLPGHAVVVIVVATAAILLPEILVTNQNQQRQQPSAHHIPAKPSKQQD